MSMLPFARNFLSAKGNQAVQAVTKAMVEMDPESASLADLKTMEQNLDRAGAAVVKLRTELAQERRDYENISKNYNELMNAAGLIKTQLETATEEQKPGLERSLGALINKLETLSPELDRDKKDIESTQELLTHAEGAYQSKTAGLKAARANLTTAKRDMQSAKLQEERAQERAQQAAEVAGLSTSGPSGLTVALDAMKQSADAARQRAESAEMKAAALQPADEAAEDANIAKALAEVRGTPASPQSLSERLAALKK